MKRLFYLLCLMTSVCILSCTAPHKEVPHLLAEADSLMWNAPDSALHLLESLPHPERLKDEARACHALLLAQARYRCYLPSTSDSLIDIALAYYILHPEMTDRLAASWYYKGTLMKGRKASPDSVITAYKEAEALIPHLQDSCLIARIYHSLGQINDDASCYGLAKEYYHKALKINVGIGDVESQVSNLTNLTGVYMMEDKTDSAQWCVDQLAKMSEQIKDSVRLRDLYHNIAFHYEIRKQYEEAEKYYNESLHYGETQEVFSSLVGLCVKMSQYEKADSIYKCLAKSNDWKSTASIHYDMYLSAKRQGNYPKAFEYVDEFIYLADSIYAESINNKVLDIQYKYDMAVQETKRIRTQQQWLYFCILILLLIGMIWLYLKKRQKKLLIDVINLQDTLLQEKNNSESYQKENSLLVKTLDEYRHKTEKELKAMKNQYLLILKTHEERNSKLSIIYKILEEHHYNPKTDRDVLKYYLTLVHKNFIETIDEVCPNIQKRIMDVCYLAALRLNVQQIAGLLEVSEISVRQYMNRFCKEIGLPESGKKAFYLYIDSLLSIQQAKNINKCIEFKS